MKKIMMRDCMYVIFWVLMLAHAAWGGTPYHPIAPVEIMTNVTAESPSGIPPTLSRFIAGPVQKMDNVSHVLFCNADSDVSIGSLDFFPDDEVDWNSKGRTAKRFHANNLLIIPGSSIPVDVMPINRLMNAQAPVEYEFHRQAGDRTFVDRIQIFIHSINKDQAMEAQWLRYKKEIPDEMKMVEAIDLQTGLLVVKQLWTNDGDWWIYEETPFRRSWRIK